MRTEISVGPKGEKTCLILIFSTNTDVLLCSTLQHDDDVDSGVEEILLGVEVLFAVLRNFYEVLIFFVVDNLGACQPDFERVLCIDASSG